MIVICAAFSDKYRQDGTGQFDVDSEKCFPIFISIFQNHAEICPLFFFSKYMFLLVHSQNGHDTQC